MLSHTNFTSVHKCESKVKNNEKTRSWGTLPGSQQFGGRRACYNFEMRTRTNDKWVNYSHGLTQTKHATSWLMHSQNTFGAQTNHGQTQIYKTRHYLNLGKQPPSPLQYSLCPTMGPTLQCHFVSRLSSWSPKILEIRTLVILEAHNFLCKVSIEVRSKAQLQPLSSIFEWYVAQHLDASKLGQFLTFNGQESNWQFNS